MFDHVLSALKKSRLGALEHGQVRQSGSAGALFAGDFGGVLSVDGEFAGSRLGIGVMDNLDGEVVSLKGRTWAVAFDGTPREVAGREKIAFGIAAHGGLRHSLRIPAGSDVTAILESLDSTLGKHDIDHDNVVCAVEIVGTFSDVVLRTVHHPDFEGESLGDIIDDEIRFSFDRWEGTLVGFRYPDTSDGLTIPGLHLHGIDHARTSGGHLRNAVVTNVSAHIWVDDLVLPGQEDKPSNAESIDFDRFEGPISEKQEGNPSEKSNG